jgi:hypothetical protein
VVIGALSGLAAAGGLSPRGRLFSLINPEQRYRKEAGSMDSGSKFLTFTSIIVLALILQVVLVLADQRDNPDKAAVEFAEAYFWLDPAMAERLCKDLSPDPENSVVQAYLQRVQNEARSLGFAPEYMKQGIYHVETKVVVKDENTADVTLTGERRRTINPVFGLVARWFAVGERHPVKETLQLVKEEDRWKVCGAPFRLIES